MRAALPALSALCGPLLGASGASAQQHAARPLPPGSLMEFQWKGHTVTRGLMAAAEFAELAAPLRAVAEAEEQAAARRKAEAMRLHGRDVEALPFVQVLNPHRKHAAARTLALAPALMAAAAAFLGVATVRLYQDSLFWKRPGHGDTAWHADLWTVPLNTNHFVTVWLPLQRVDPGCSPLFYLSQTEGDSGPGADPAGLPRPGVIGEHHAPLAEGDATWHHGWTLHGAPPVAGGASERLAYTAAYYSDEVPVLGKALEGLASRRRGHSSIEVDSASAPRV